MEINESQRTHLKDIEGYCCGGRDVAKWVEVKKNAGERWLSGRRDYIQHVTARQSQLSSLQTRGSIICIGQISDTITYQGVT
jgi:phosphopentomutase